MSKQLKRGALALVAAAALGVAGTMSAYAAPTEGPTEHTDMGVTGADVMKHLEQLSDISLKYPEDGYRALGTPGYAEASDYVEQVFTDAGYNVSRQTFTMPSQSFGTVEFSVNGEAVESFSTMSNAEGTSDPLVDVPLAVPADDNFGDGAGAELGCEAGDYPESAGIVIVSRGTCAFGQKVTAASQAGAQAVIIYNHTDEAAQNFTVGERVEGNIPAGSMSKADGERLRDLVLDAAEGEEPTGNLTLETTFEETETWNIIAETKAGDPNNVQMMGAHLDGVPQGPGVNDNASGVAGLLAVAEGLAAQPTEVDNMVRFGIWGAEEVGLVGSTKYVESLSDAELSKVKAYLNYDMIGSNNYAINTLDANGDYREIPEGVTVPEGSVELEKIYTDYFDSIDQKYIGGEFSGRSDYQAFMNAGIPVSGLDSGADEIKTEQEAEWFGGTAGQQMDTNYHQITDTIENINRESVDIIAPAMAFAAHTLAYELVEPAPTEEPSQPAPTEEPSQPAPTEDDDQTATPTLTIEPQQISPADFVAADKGVVITATACTPGTTATLNVAAIKTTGNVEAFENSETVDENGTVVFNVRGLSEDNPESYVGEYSVEVTCEGLDALTGTFTVGDADTDANSGNNSDDKSADSLPRTGTDATTPIGIAAAVLLGLGALLLALTRRRAVKQD